MARQTTKKEVNEMANKPALHTCPACGKKKGAEVVYGLPDQTAWRFIDQGLLVAGGCMREGDAPDYECTACNHQWNKPFKR
jgi:DNA-directed RNA polymerase subunit M/transcription elongation factor TFIIS